MREWKPISLSRLKEIISDTEKDAPNGDYCPAEVYQLAREVEQSRKVNRKSQPTRKGVKP